VRLSLKRCIISAEQMTFVNGPNNVYDFHDDALMT